MPSGLTWRRTALEARPFLVTGMLFMSAPVLQAQSADRSMPAPAPTDVKQAAPASDPAEAARKVWLTRGVGMPGALRAVEAFEAWAKARPEAEAYVGLSRALYWLGLMQADAKAGKEAQSRSYSRGVAAGQKAQKIAAREPGGYYWEAVNIAKNAELSGIVSSAGELPTLMRLMDKVDELQPGYFYGGTNRYWGAVITRTPSFLVALKGQSLEDGADYFRKSLKQSPEFLGTRVFWAELKLKDGDRAGAVKLLKEVVAAPPSSDPDIAVWNEHEKRRARDRLGQLGEK